MKSILVCLFLFTQYIWAQGFRADILNNEEILLHQSSYVFIGHASSEWDEQQLSRRSILDVIQTAKNNKIPIIASVDNTALIDSETAQNYFFKQDDVNILLASNAGQHKLTFTNARKMFFAGGNLTYCLCESIRDFVRGNLALQKKQSIQIYLIRDAIFDWNPKLHNISRIDADELIMRFFLKSFQCPNQNFYKFKPLFLKNIRLDVFYDKQLLRQYDLEPNMPPEINRLTQKIELHFIDSRDLQNYL